MTGSLFIITGPPGAGKSTVAKMVADRTEHSVLVEGDAFFGFLATGFIEPWLPESHEQNGIVTEAAAAATARFVSGGYRTVYDGVLGPWFIDRFFAQFGSHFSGQAAADASTWPIDYAILLPPVERCIERVRARVGHGFSDEAATTKMHSEFTTASIAARHVLNNDGEPPEQTAARLLAGATDGTFRFRVEV